MTAIIDIPTGTANSEAPNIRRARAIVASLPSKLKEQREALLRQEQALHAAEAVLREHQKNEQRKKRTRLVSHAGGMMEMAGLLEYRYIDSSIRDNNQDDLRANLLVGALLQLARQLSIAKEEELKKLTDDGKAYRATKPSARPVPKVNPLIPMNDLS